MSINPYFWSKNTYTVKLDELEVPAKLDKLDKLEIPTKLDELEAPLPTLEVPRKLTKPTKPTIKCG
jgi:hypothetical protein